jgi:hypothetical protein
MTALMIKQTVSGGRPVYNFESRKVDYTVIDREDGTYEVWSSRQSCSFSAQVVVMTLKEMSARTKALKNLVALIQTEETEVPA